LPVDVRELEVDDLRHAQAGTIGHSERGLVLDAMLRVVLSQEEVARLIEAAPFASPSPTAA